MIPVERKPTSKNPHPGDQVETKVEASHNNKLKKKIAGNFSQNAKRNSRRHRTASCGLLRSWTTPENALRGRNPRA